MKAFSLSLTLFSLFLLFGCGGGGGSLERDATNNTGSGTGDPGTTETTYTVSLSLVNQNNEPDRELNENNALNLKVNVKNQNQQPLTDVLISFTLSSDALASFNNDTGTAITDNEGNASIGLVVESISGAGRVTATLPDGTDASISFNSAGTVGVSEQPSDVAVVASTVQLPSSGSDQVQLIAQVKNARSVLMEGVPVTFSALSGDSVEIQQVDAVTQENGTATATLTTRSNATNRTVSITASAGSLKDSVTIDVFGTEITVNGARSMTLNDRSALTVRAQNSDGENIANQDIVVHVDGGFLALDGAASESREITVNTGPTGQANVFYIASESGVHSVTASALNATFTFAIMVQEDKFSFTSFPTDDIQIVPEPINIADYATLVLTWSKENTPYENGAVSFTASRGVIASGFENGLTDSNGQVVLRLASSSAGVSSITATGVDAQNNEVTAVLEVEFVATVADSLIVDASPDIVGPDGQTSTITAVVRDRVGNLVKGKLVSFNVFDTSTGTISPSQALTDSNGLASTVFTSGAVNSNEFVSITASVVEDNAVSDTVSLTVGNRAFDIVIGTGNVIESPTTTSYMKEFSVFVSDSAGRPIENVELTASVSPVKFSHGGRYYKGFWAWNGTNWVIAKDNQNASIDTPVLNRALVCANEDKNDNGILDIGEDTNRDEFLTPGIVGTLSFAGGVTTTDENGQATLQLRYPRNYAGFYDSEITIFGQSTGSESSANIYYRYGIAAEHIADENAPPPPSPFGIVSGDDDEDCTSYE